MKRRQAHGVRFSPLMLALIAGVSPAFTGCGTTARYAGTSVHQVRQGERFVIEIEQADGTGGEVFGAAAGVALAAAAIGEVVSFASGELQKHFERVAALHEAGYGASAVELLDPAKPFTIALRRYAENDKGGERLVFEAKYKVESHKVEGKNDRVLVVKPFSIGVTHAATRLASTRQAFEVDVTMTFQTVALGEKPEDPVEIKALGDPLKQAVLVSIAKELPKNELDDGDNVIGMMIWPDAAESSGKKLLGLTIAVSERDPSRAADRNRQAAEALKSLTPSLIDFAREKAGVSKEESEQ